ncbi:MAG: MFS transporter, partial [Kiritimatiellae bacterium]|nr:MFS transporter [Kiritimatiellia bacterium]
MAMRKTAFIMFIAGFGGMLFDFGGSIIAPAIPYLESLGTFTAEQISRLTSAAVLSASVSCFLTGFAADRFGRKPTMLLSGLAAAVAAIPICLCDLVPEHAFALFYAGRFLQGLAAGAVGVVVPMYLVETLSPGIRGKGAAVFQLLDIIGVFCCSLVGIAVVHFFGPADGATVSTAAKTLAWKTVFSSSVVPSLVFFFGVLAIPESPVWLRRGEKTVECADGGKDDGALLRRKYVL